MKSLTTTIDDFMDAAIDRLRDWSPLSVERWTARVADLVSRGIGIAEDQPEVARLLIMLPRDRRSRWSALCALVALYADLIENEQLKFSAGLEVWLAQRQARFGDREVNALSRAIERHIIAHPAVTNAEIFEHFCAIAGQKDCPVKKYDKPTQVLIFEPEPGREQKLNDREAFFKNVRRARKRLARHRVALLPGSPDSYVG